MNAPENEDIPGFDVYSGDDPGPDPAKAASGASDAADGGSNVARLQAELAEAKDQTLRALAEADNVRKRLRREADEQRRYAEQLVLTDLLPVLDNLYRAADASGNAADAAKLAEGVKLVIQQFEGVLAKHHCERIDAAGKPFDPNFHEALVQQASADVPPGTVLNVYREGYRLHDRVIRPAQVVVSKAPD
jgi:molecular chaperone GrpE